MQLNFEKGDGLLPVIVQNALTEKVLMLGFMNQTAYDKTVAEQKVTFFSRTKNRLWTKGETSGNFLLVKNIAIDCDKDTILVKALPKGPTCHSGAESCFEDTSAKGFVYQLQDTISSRIDNKTEKSYTSKLFQRGIDKVAQKVGEEAVELVIEAKNEDDDRFIDEAADLLYHYLILLKAKNFTLEDIEQRLLDRAK